MISRTSLLPAMTLAALSLATLVGCSGSDGTPGGGGSGNLSEDDNFLARFGSKSEFTSTVREALIGQYGQNGGGRYYAESTDGIAAPADPTAGADSVASESDLQTGADDSGSSDSTGDITGTNVQEAGVDEADRIKTDGSYLYVLDSSKHGYGIAEPLPVDVAIDGTYFYEPYHDSQLRILSLDVEGADAAEINTLTLSPENGQPDGLYLYNSGGNSTLMVTSSTMSGYWGAWDTGYSFQGQKSTLRKIDVTDPSSASITDTLTIDGQIISSRRIGGQMVIASRYFPHIPEIDRYYDNSVTIETLVNDIPDDDLLPGAVRASDEAIQSLADANNCFVASKAGDYYSPDIITIALVDIDTLSVSDSVCYLGSSETLYVSPDAAFLATTRYGHVGIATDDTVDVAVSVPAEPVDPDDGVTSDSDAAIWPIYDPRIETDIHQFDIAAGGLTYRGSGSVEGHLGWNVNRKPFRMSARNGYLRVATQNDDQSGTESPVIISILEPSGGTLNTIARLPNSEFPQHIGKPREDLYASRFLGDKAYLVTFRQIDPLYVADLSNPRAPKLTGELEIEGYSDYLQPVGENHLLGIGRGAIITGEGAALATGVKVTLFDVSDATNPTEVQSLEIGKRGSHSEALYDHHGITVQQASDDHPARLTLGIDVNDKAGAGELINPWTWYQWTHSGLYAFEVATDANAGLNHHGTIVAESNDGSRYGPSRSGDRSTIIGDTVYYVHGEQVFGANWNTMSIVNGPR